MIILLTPHYDAFLLCRSFNVAYQMGITNHVVGMKMHSV